MIDLIFTVDYELYGDGTGSLADCVIEPAEKLREAFQRHGAPFVAFIEAAEFEMMESKGNDEALPKVREQIRAFYASGIEIGLHLHPQWYGATCENGRWALEYGEYNLCVLPEARIDSLIRRSIRYLRGLLREREFTPLAFRAGNWLFQPTRTLAEVLTRNGIRIDSSVFKGGRQRQYGLDYRKTVRNGYYWSFSHRVEEPDPGGPLIELPVYTRMVPFWKMLKSKRISIQRKAISRTDRDVGHGKTRWLDYSRFRYPLKLDYCRMTIHELRRMTDRIIREDRQSPGVYRPVVAIGHTKDLEDPETIVAYLSYLKDRGIRISTFQEAYPRCQ